MTRRAVWISRTTVNNVPAPRDECNVSSRLLKFDWAGAQLISANVNVFSLILVSRINRVPRNYHDWIYIIVITLGFHLLSQEINYSPSTKLWQPRQRNVIINLSYFQNVSSLLTVQLETVTFIRCIKGNSFIISCPTFCKITRTILSSYTWIRAISWIRSSIRW